MSDLHSARTADEVRLLLRAGASPVGHAHTPLVWKTLDATLLLIRAGVDVGLVDAEGMTPIFHVECSACPDTVAALVRAGAGVNHRDVYDRTPLLASVTDDFSLALIRNGADVRAADFRGHTPLLRSLLFHNHATSGVIVEGCGVEVNDRDAEGYTVLHRLCAYLNLSVTGDNDDYDATSEALWLGADVHAPDARGDRAVNLCRTSGKNLRNIIGEGGDPASVGFLGNNPLHTALNCEVLGVLLGYDVDVDSVNKPGDSALMSMVVRIGEMIKIAYRCRRFTLGHLPGGLALGDVVAMCDMLLARGASCFLRNIAGQSALDLAASSYPPLGGVLEPYRRNELWGRRRELVMLRRMDRRGRGTPPGVEVLEVVLTAGGGGLAYDTLRDVLRVNDGVFRTIVSWA